MIGDASVSASVISGNAPRVLPTERRMPFTLRLLPSYGTAAGFTNRRSVSSAADASGGKLSWRSFRSLTWPGRTSVRSRSAIAGSASPTNRAELGQELLEVVAGAGAARRRAPRR